MSKKVADTGKLLKLEEENIILRSEIERLRDICFVNDWRF